MHDLLLDFARYRIEQAPLEKAVLCQAQYLGRLDIVWGYAIEGDHIESYYSLMALWRSVEALSSSTRLQVDEYGASLRVLAGEVSAEAANLHAVVGKLFYMQVSKLKELAGCPRERARHLACGNNAPRNMFLSIFVLNIVKNPTRVCLSAELTTYLVAT